MALAQERLYTEDDYYNFTEKKPIELIHGEIFFQAAPSRIHQEILMALSKTIANYIDAKGGPCKIYPAPFAVKLGEKNNTIVEPDISIICDPDKLTEKGCTGSPDWIIEIASPSNIRIDYVKKLNLYVDAGVREYWIVNPMDKSIYVYHLEETVFETTSYTFNDTIKVNIYNDLMIDFTTIV